MCHLIVPKICGTPGFTEKDGFSTGFQKQFKQRMLGNHNPESSFCQKCEIFREFFVAIAQNVPSDCSPIFAGLQDSQKKAFFERFTGNVKKE